MKAQNASTVLLCSVWYFYTTQNRNILIAINIMTYLLLQYFCMDCDGYTVNTALFHDLLLIQNTYVTN